MHLGPRGHITPAGHLTSSPSSRYRIQGEGMAAIPRLWSPLQPHAGHQAVPREDKDPKRPPWQTLTHLPLSPSVPPLPHSPQPKLSWPWSSSSSRPLTSPALEKMSGAAPWTSPSTSVTGPSGEALQSRDRRVFLAYDRHCPAPDLPHRSSSATPVAPSAPPVSSSPHSPYLPLDLLAVGRRSTVVAACSR